ncbi:Lysine-rich arabinogalactan protein 18 [Frankliniella fusca]|uniref:Lysine-rich arabinogalactan protein 18 n=1 Tax=Frankliniella fusca TaxID=407009 RepID=A0AAE1LQ67_9NEOP|nr:Lysine-rich arabinogalactan protein 18 [Frankliniella fusca]
MEPPGNPVSSPIKSPSSSIPISPATSPIGSTASSAIKSAASSPNRSIQSSPPTNRSIQSSPPRSVPSSPFVGVILSPFEGSQSHDANFHEQHCSKRQKLETVEKLQATCSNFTGQENMQHCRQLFAENFECTKEGNSSSAVNNDKQDENNLQSSGSNVQMLVEIHEMDCEVCGVGGSRERTSSSSSCSSSSSSSVEELCSATSSEGEDSESESSSEDNESSNQSEEEENSSSDESDKEFFSPLIHEGCQLTVDEGVLELMDMFTKFKLSKKQMGGILKSILKFIPDSSDFPRTEYMLFEYVKKLCPISDATTHYYCSVCNYYLGTDEIQCTICQNESHSFFQIPLAEQIRNLFENHGLADIIDKYNAERSHLDVNAGYSDLLDGSEFKKAHIEGQYNLDLLGHTDGISVSISSFVSLWPFEWVIAQIPTYLRFKFVLVNGIWLDETKPYMNTMVKPFAKELQELNKNGVTWTHPRTKVVHKSFITAPCFCADAPARAQLQNILSHGGKHCCHFCEQKMKKLPPQPIVLGQKKKARRRVYTLNENTARLRTAQRMEDQGSQARNIQRESGRKLKPVKGVRGPSEISKFPGCDRSTAVFPEYMHLIMCLIKEFMRLWFEVDGPWSLKEHRDKINAFLESISVPDYITRIPRSTEHFTKWKANEFRSFLLFFSVIILSHIGCFFALYLLLQDCVSESDVTKANLSLRIFCRSFAFLYKPEFYTYYVHQLCHLALTVQRYGPFHCNSAFMFESFNGTLAKYIHGTKNQGKELVNNIRIAFGVEVLRTRTIFGAAAASKLQIDFKNQIQHFDFKSDLKLLHSRGVVQEPLRAFYRAIIRHKKFTSSLYTRQKKRNNFTVCFLSSSSNQKAYGAMKYFCQSADNQKVALVERFDVDHLRTFCHEDSGIIIQHIIPIVPTKVIEAIDISAILFKVIRVGNYVCLRPN